MKKIFIFLLYVLLMPVSVSAQVLVTGTILDDSNEELPAVIIKCYAPGHRMRAYATSKEDGAFSISAVEGDSLNFSMLGYKSQNLVVRSGMKPLTVKMSNAAVQLKEVTVKSDRLHDRGDTTTYIVGAYANGNDRSIGDVIAKIPGFSIEKSTGRISYEGKPISNFYIEGLNMLGGKYGVATNTLPQADVASVQVMRHHQPIRVLEDFTYTDDAAVNIKMKNSAKNRWVTSWKAGGGWGDNHSADGRGDEDLWQLEGFGLRLNADLQTMLTYKTNNTGVDVSRESTSLFDLGELSRQQPQDFISLSAPSASSIESRRSLFNRSHAVTANVMKRISEASQVNMQLVYNNERDRAWGHRTTEYTRNNGNTVISNSKSFLETGNDLYALLKYEHNSDKSYLRNSLSGDMKWLTQHLDETGTNPHHQYTRIPVYDFRDDLYAIRKYGNKLLSFYSYNTIQNRPQHLYVDTLTSQGVTQRYFSTDTYGMGALGIGKFSLTLRVGVKGLLRHISSTAWGLPDSIGNTADKSRFGYAKLYASPELGYSTRDVKISLSVPFEESYYKYSRERGRNRFSVSPSASIRWDVTSRFSMSLNGDYSAEPLDFNRFYGALIMQDYLYLNRGYSGYEEVKRKSLGYSIRYRNALNGTHLIASVTRSFDTNPYTMTRDFIGDYIILGTRPVETHDDGWTGTLMYQQGLPWLSGKLTLRCLYSCNNSKMLQDNDLLASRYNILNTKGSLYLSPYRDMTITYTVNYSYNDMRTDNSRRTSFNKWQHEMSVVLPLKKFRLQIDGEYNHNQISTDRYKDIFFADFTLGYKGKLFDIELNASNLFNKRVYAYSTVADLMTMQSSTTIRGREIMLTVIYTP